MLRKCLIAALLIAASPLAAPPAAGQGSLNGFTICYGDYALCAASTCTPTGGTIAVNTAGGGKANFPAATCACPILTGYAIADLKGGNMQGSCAPPPGNGVWSLYAPMTDIPQAITNWSDSPAPAYICPASLGQGSQLANCFSFACTRAGSKNGVPLATCTCPLGESVQGTAVPANTAFVTQAGQWRRGVR